MSDAMAEVQEVEEGPRVVPEDTFASRLVLLRHDLGVTVDQVSAMCGIASATWSTWEHGTNPRDKASAVRQISDGTGYDREWLMWGEIVRRYLASVPTVNGQLSLLDDVGGERALVLASVS